MIRFYRFAAAITFIASLVTPNALSGQSHEASETPYVPGQVMIQLNEGYNIEHVTSAFPLYLQVKPIEELSSHMRIWHLSFNHHAVSHAELIRMLSSHRAVSAAQNNHYVKERATVPNDPNFTSQWQHRNTGQNGGTADADIDSDEAWDITTGGLTNLGDTIVVCILEGGGGNYNHPDLIGNFWRNTQEIPGNGIDDDGNGYIDDVRGWRVQANNDNHASGNHGTQVMGMIGATGNNSVGVVGANWNVKMMLVSGFTTQESSVIQAYTYPLAMRKLYNQTNGAKGAFVVATNASWGIDQANPNNYPLWCAMYDTLGRYGVLNCGSTTNSNYNVDVVGDMPTACSSDYMISVTATNNRDVRTFSGYGQTTIDVGAPGESIYTTSGTNSYGSTSGTSFAGPLTAGVIALMYSAPCNSLALLAKNNPQAAADLVRQALFDGVDPKSNLLTETVTGGRINAFNSLTLLMNDCSTSDCIAPFNLSADSLTTNSANLAWVSANTSNTYLIRYRETGSSTWLDSTSSSVDSLFLDGLEECTEYEFQVKADCGGGEESNYSVLYTFKTDGCCEPPTSLTVTLSDNTSGSATWSSVLAAQSYNLRYKSLSSGTWITVNNATSPYALSDLDECTAYEIQVQSVCVSGPTAFSASSTFNTAGCGNCVDLSYCNSKGNNVSDEWIQAVEFGTINNVSGSDGGYADYTAMSTQVIKENSYNLKITPGYSGSTYSEYYKVWIDYNQDGVFDEATELAYTSGSGVTTGVNAQILIPATANTGSTRMRVSMKYVGPLDNGAPTACMSFAYGEVEDYCLFIEQNTSVEEWNEVKLMIYPNPASDVIVIEGYDTDKAQGVLQIKLINATGMLVSSTPMNGKRTQLDVSELASGIYFLQVSDDSRQLRSERIIINR